MTLTEQQVRVVNLIEVRGKRPRALDAPPPRHRPFNLRPCVVGRRGLARERDRAAPPLPHAAAAAGAARGGRGQWAQRAPPT